MAIARPVSASSSAAVAALHHQRNLSSHAGSGGVWGLARKVCLFFLVVLGLVLIIRGCRVSVTRTVHQRQRRRNRATDDFLDRHGSLHRVVEDTYREQQENSSRRQVVDTRVSGQKSIPMPLHLNAVELHVPAELTIRVGRPSALMVSADQNVMEALKSYTRSGTLVLEQEPNISLDIRTPIRYTLDIPDLQEVVVSTTGKIMIDRLNIADFSCTISGSSEVTITEGNVQQQSITVSGSGKYRASAVVSNVARVTLSGNASAHIKTPQQTLGVELSGNSKCYYTGGAPVFSATYYSGNAKVLPERR
ncbi:MAG TPA: DUF2807 domain-containing protein [Rhabdochlamydiaceae bacterium]|nr:DUF2807 domain-containing protein [Rhabdochlamydiaceae bacterium]